VTSQVAEQELRERSHLSIMIGELLAVRFNQSNLVVSKPDGSQSVVKRSVGIGFFDSSEFTSLLPVSCPVFQRLCQSFSTKVPDLGFINREQAMIFEVIK
jgi:hypothetical protein